ncbi:hypothetical protein AYI70_g948, partial [Smittium culicis]
NKHFGDLAKDTTGNSRSAIKMRELLSGDEDYFPESDDSIKWSEITKTLNDTPNNKAPGVDGVPSEIWKMVMSEKSPTSDLAKIIHKIINIMYDSGEIPSFMTTSIIVPVPKKGVDVPGLPNRIPGLLFADNAVVLANSDENLQISLDVIRAWSDAWEMAVNASKCAIMAINCDDAVEMTQQRQNIRTADNYTYLGYIMNIRWDVSGTINNNKLKAHKTLYSAYGFLNQ